MKTPAIHLYAIFFLLLFVTSNELHAQWSGGTTLSQATEGIQADSVYQDWVARYDGEWHSDDGANALGMDGTGNVYVTGRALFSATGSDYVTIKYDVSGTVQWVVKYNGPGNAYDQATSLVVDKSGSVYVTGESYGSGTSVDYATIKYDSSGTEEWVARYNGENQLPDLATAIAIDGSGNAYVTGHGLFADTGDDYVTIKYDASGAEQWVSRYDGPTIVGSADFATALALDDSGNAYVTGWSYDSTTYYDYVTIKYDSSGTEEWVARYNGPGNRSDLATALAVDGSGNIYVTGRSFGLAIDYDYATIKYDASGTEQWVARYNWSGNDGDYGDEATALVLDGSGNVYVTGRSYDLGTDYDYLTIKYDASGAEQWVARYNGPGNDNDEATALVVDKSGSVYATGGSYGSGTDYDYATIKYDTFGTVQWIVQYNGPGNAYDHATAVAIDASLNVYLTGSSFGSSTSEDYATVKYQQIQTGVKSGVPIPAEVSLTQNYPNPFNPSTTIEYALPRSTYVKLEIFNVLGEMISLLKDGSQNAGYHSVVFEVEGLPSGIYFYRLQTEDFVETKKLVLMR